MHSPLETWPVYVRDKQSVSHTLRASTNSHLHLIHFKVRTRLKSLRPIIASKKGSFGMCRSSQWLRLSTCVQSVDLTSKVVGKHTFLGQQKFPGISICTNRVS